MLQPWRRFAWGAGVVLIAWAAAGAGSAGPAPRRVMSLNLCTDALVLQLLPPQRIASVTFLSRDPAYSTQMPLARAVGVNHGTAEDVLLQRPDLVIGGAYTAPVTRRLLARLHIPLVEVKEAESFADIRATTRQVADAVGERARADALIAGMDAKLAALARTRPQPPVRVVGWDGNGAAPGRGTLFNAILSAAGGVNVASSTPDQRPGAYDLEQLLIDRPQVIAHGDSAVAAPSLQAAAAQHPLLRKLYRGREVTYPELIYSCGTTEAADAAGQLRRKLLQAVGQGR